jgi:signal transduction histidine kinase
VAGTTVVISFADNGSGIPERIRQSIFDPFFTTKGVGKGTGQGLALARAVLDKHGGSIDVRSVLGEGTEFTLRLPIAGRPDPSG